MEITLHVKPTALHGYSTLCDVHRQSEVPDEQTKFSGDIFVEIISKH
jgi:hypothetical protein